MTLTLWRWYPYQDDWEQVTQASSEMSRKVMARYKRHDTKGARYRWTTGVKPKKFRARTKEKADG